MLGGSTRVNIAFILPSHPNLLLSGFERPSNLSWGLTTHSCDESLPPCILGSSHWAQVVAVWFGASHQIQGSHVQSCTFTSNPQIFPAELTVPESHLNMAQSGHPKTELLCKFIVRNPRQNNSTIQASHSTHPLHLQPKLGCLEGPFTCLDRLLLEASVLSAGIGRFLPPLSFPQRSW